MWAVTTPYAEEYGAPWLYGLAALTNASRVLDREHWLSDTVGGAALGYVMGSLAWQARRARKQTAPTVVVGPRDVYLRWELE
jgi:membrane-associated phospholipid phosphatase